MALAATWNPRGELPRAQRLIGHLRALYAGLHIVTPPDIDRAIISGLPDAEFVASGDWYGGRHHALRAALASGADTIHYCDFDRLLHWLECYPDELRRALERMKATDCLVTGRTARAWDTHPRCMIETEALFNLPFSRMIGASMDFGAGSRGLSRRAAAFLMEHGSPAWGWAVDTAWVILPHRAGYGVEYMAVDGLEWETPDQHQSAAASPAARAALAAEYDRDPDIWQQRVDVAHEIMRVGLVAAELALKEGVTDG